MTLSRTYSVLAALTAASALVLAACGGDGSSNSSPATGTASGETVAVAKVDGVGDVLVDSQGAALYSPDQETGGKVLCTGACTSIWVPLTLPDGAQPTGSSDVSRQLGVVQRPDDTAGDLRGEAPLQLRGGPRAANGDRKRLRRQLRRHEPSPGTSPRWAPSPAARRLRREATATETAWPGRPDRPGCPTSLVAPDAWNAQRACPADPGRPPTAAQLSRMLAGVTRYAIKPMPRAPIVSTASDTGSPPNMFTSTHPAAPGASVSSETGLHSSTRPKRNQRTRKPTGVAKHRRNRLRNHCKAGSNTFRTSPQDF